MKVQIRDTEILVEREDLLMVAKPPGILSIPDRYDPTKPNLYQWLKLKYGALWQVHRLDRETSGVMVFARDADAHAFLSKAFEERRVEKVYHALVIGHPPSEGSIDKPITANKNRPGTMKAAKKGKPSVSLFKVLEYFKDCSLVELRPQTGRTHQLRVHMQSIGFPLMIDPLYGSEHGIYLSKLKPNFRHKQFEEERPLMDRLTLHALKLTIPEVRNDGQITAEAELPKDFRVVLSNMRKYRTINREMNG